MNENKKIQACITLPAWLYDWTADHKLSRSAIIKEALVAHFNLTQGDENKTMVTKSKTENMDIKF
jgi:hypothetical protein